MDQQTESNNYEVVESGELNGWRWIVSIDGDGFRFDTYLSGNLYEGKNGYQDAGRAETTARSWCMLHKPIGPHLGRMATTARGSRVIVTDRSSGEELFRTETYLSETDAWAAAQRWAETGTEEEPVTAELNEAVTEVAPAAAPQVEGPVVGDKVACPVCGKNVALRKGLALGKHKPNKGALVDPDKNGYCSGSGHTLGECASIIESVGDAKAAAPKDELKEAAAEALDALKESGAMEAEEAKRAEASARAAALRPANADEIWTLLAQREEAHEHLRLCNSTFNRAKEDCKQAQAVIDDLNSQIGAAYRNANKRQVSLPLHHAPAEEAAEEPAQSAEEPAVVTEDWPHNGRRWSITCKKINDERFLALCRELVGKGDTEGHGATSSAAIEEAKGKIALLLEDTDPGEMPEKPKRGKAKKTAKRRGSTGKGRSRKGARITAAEVVEG